MWYLTGALLSFCMLLFDQWVKQMVTVQIPLGESRPFLPGLMELYTVHNYGAAWSMFLGMRWPLIVITSAVILLLLGLLIKKIVRHPTGILACCLIIAGGLGNVLDRVRLGYVVDMFHLLFMKFPVFNVADVCINIGCALGILYYLCFYEKRDQNRLR